MWDPARLGQAPPPVARQSFGYAAQRPPGLGGSMPMRQPMNSPGGRHMMQPGEAMAGPRGMPMIQALGERQNGMGVRPGVNQMGGPAVAPPQGPSLQDIQAEMQRRQIGAQLGPRNAALSGYMMGQ